MRSLLFWSLLLSWATAAETLFPDLPETPPETKKASPVIETQAPVPTEVKPEPIPAPTIDPTALRIIAGQSTRPVSTWGKIPPPPLLFMGSTEEDASKRWWDPKLLGVRQFRTKDLSGLTPLVWEMSDNGLPYVWLRLELPFTLSQGTLQVRQAITWNGKTLRASPLFADWVDGDKKVPWLRPSAQVGAWEASPSQLPVTGIVLSALNAVRKEIAVTLPNEALYLRLKQSQDIVLAQLPATSR